MAVITVPGRHLRAVPEAQRYRRLRAFNVIASVILAAEGRSCWWRATASRCR